MTDRESLFIPLADAAAMVHEAATGETNADTVVLEELAASIAMNVVIYAREGWGPNMLMIRPEVLHYAEFKDRGNMMRSRNVTYSAVASSTPLLRERDAEPEPPSPKEYVFTFSYLRASNSI